MAGGTPAGTVARQANWTIGGGPATIEVLRRGLERRGWISDADHQRLFAAARVTPGTNVLAYCTAAGWHLRGFAGAIAALLAASVPCGIVALIVTVLFDRLEARLFAVLVIVGMTIALALLTIGAWHLARPHLTRALAWRSGTVIALAIALFAAGLSPLWTVLAAALVGAAWPHTP